MPKVLCLVLPLVLAGMSGCGKHETSDFNKFESIFEFNDTLDIVKISFAGPSTLDDGSNLHVRFYLVKKSKKERPKAAGFEMPYWDDFHYFRNDTSFYVSNSRKSLAIIEFGRKQTVSHTQYPGIILSNGYYEINRFGVAGGKKYYLYDTTLVILDASGTRTHTYRDFVDPGLKYLSFASIFDDNILMLQRSDDTLCVYKMNGNGVEDFCDTLSFDFQTRFWVKRDTLINDDVNVRPNMRSKFLMDFEKEELTPISTDSFQVPVSLAMRNFIAYGDSVRYSPGDFK